MYIVQCTTRPKSPPHSVILTHVVYTIKEKFLIDDDMIPCLPNTRLMY